MSADNWAQCPRCMAKDANEIATLEVKANEAYGVLSVESFDALRDELARRRVQHDDYNAFRTFREDYEFYGAEEGAVTASYRGGCSVCGLRLEFEHTVPLGVES